MGQLLPIYPVYLLLFRQQGLSLAEISTLLIIWCIPGIFLELPSSVLADCWNRRNMMALGRLMKAGCFAVWALFPEYAGFAAGFVLWGAGGSLCSGTEEAWLYDAMKVAGREDSFDREWGLGTFYSQLAVGIAFVCGSLVASISMGLALWLSVGITAAGALLALVLPERNLHGGKMVQAGISEAFGTFMATLRAGFGFCVKNRFISMLVGFNVTVLITAGILDEYDQLIAISMGVPFALVGLWGFLRYASDALGGGLAWRLKHAMDGLGVKQPFSRMILLAFGAGFLLLLSAGVPTLWMLPAYGLFYFLMAAGKVLFTENLQSSIRDEGRATVQSISSLLESPFAMLIYAMIAVVGGEDRLQHAMAAVAALILILCGLFRIAVRKRQVPQNIS
jgi:hypothetical protein